MSLDWKGPALAALPVAAIVVDDAGKMVHATELAATMLESTPDGLISTRVDALLPGLADAPVGSDAPAHMSVLRTDGQPLAVDVTVRGFTVQSRTFRIVVLRPSAGLEGEVAELRRANYELEQFASVAAHDLREPLRSIDGFTKLVRRRLGHAVDAETTEFFDFTLAAVERMGTLIQDLLAWTRVESKGQPLERVSLADMWARVLRAVDAQIRAANAEVRTADDLPDLEADARQVAQLLAIVLDNSLAFRKPDGPAVVDIDAVLQQGMVEVRISDQGIGIPPDKLAHVVGPFVRLQSREEHAGTGLGLAIANRIVARHGGRLRIESVEGKGTTVVFTLPAAK